MVVITCSEMIRIVNIYLTNIMEIILYINNYLLIITFMEIVNKQILKVLLKKLKSLILFIISVLTDNKILF